MARRYFASAAALSPAISSICPSITSDGASERSPAGGLQAHEEGARGRVVLLAGLQPGHHIFAQRAELVLRADLGELLLGRLVFALLDRLGPPSRGWRSRRPDASSARPAQARRPDRCGRHTCAGGRRHRSARDRAASAPAPGPSGRPRRRSRGPARRHGRRDSGPAARSAPAAGRAGPPAAWSSADGRRPGVPGPAGPGRREEERTAARRKAARRGCGSCVSHVGVVGPPPPSGTVQSMFCAGSLMSHVLQCTQFCALIWKRGWPLSAVTTS